MSRPGGEHSPRVAELSEHERKALDLRIAGKTFQQIADAMATTRTTAYRWVVAALEKADEAMAERAAEHRELEAQRLNALLASLWTNALAGEPGVVDRVLKIMERRAKLLGLDAPARAELSGPDGGPLETVARVVELPPERDDGRPAGVAVASEPGPAD